MNELLPLPVDEVCRRLSVPLDEFVRWCVLEGIPHDDWMFSARDLPSLAQRAGWLPLLPADAPQDVRSRLPRALQVMREGGHFDGKSLRADALWRGLPTEHARAMEHAVQRLISGGLLLKRPGEGPLQISIPREADARLSRLDDPAVSLDDVVPSPS